MKTKLLLLVVLMGMSSVLIAQPLEKGPKNFRTPGQGSPMRAEMREKADKMKLTDAQKEEFRKSMLAMQKQLLPLRNELGEATARQKSLMMAEKPDQNAINKNIEKIGAIKVEMAKIQAKNQVDRRAQLTDEQKLMAGMHQGKMRQMQGEKGMRKGMRQMPRR